MVDTKFRIFAENSENVYDDTSYDNSNSTNTSSRKYGNKPGTPVDSKLQNTALKTATLISKALLDVIVTNSSLGLSSSEEELEEAILAGLKNIKVNDADKLDGLHSTSFARLAYGNNFTIQPKYNNNILLTYNDKISSAVSADSADTATNLAVVPIFNINGNAINITVGGKTSNNFTVPYATNSNKATMADYTDSDTSKGTINARLLNLGERIANIINGTTVVKKANQDANGDVIHTTYLKKSDVGTIGLTYKRTGLLENRYFGGTSTPITSSEVLDAGNFLFIVKIENNKEIALKGYFSKVANEYSYFVSDGYYKSLDTKIILSCLYAEPQMKMWLSIRNNSQDTNITGTILRVYKLS